MIGPLIRRWDEKILFSSRLVLLSLRVLTQIKLRDFRCFDSLECEFSPETNLIFGPNAQGKTSLLEAACVLLRLQSPRTASLAAAIHHERRGFVLDGFWNAYHLQFYYGRQRKKLALDSVEQANASEYLRLAKVVWISNLDMEIVRGSAEQRRRFLDFTASQLDPAYRQQCRFYEKALRARNFLLKAPRPRWKEIDAFTQPLVDSAHYIQNARSRLVQELQPAAEDAQRQIAKAAESLRIDYVCSGSPSLLEALAANRDEDLRLRQTSVGPHRDDLGLSLNGIGSSFASEGQQRSIALSLKLAQARLLGDRSDSPPILLMDDIFGELDPDRRNALMQYLPGGTQKLITTTNLDWLEASFAATRFHMRAGELKRVD